MIYITNIVPFKKRNDSSDIFSAKFQKSIEEEWIKMNMQQHWQSELTKNEKEERSHVWLFTWWWGWCYVTHGLGQIWCSVFCTLPPVSYPLLTAGKLLFNEGFELCTLEPVIHTIEQEKFQNPLFWILSYVVKLSLTLFCLGNVAYGFLSPLISLNLYFSICYPNP